MKKPKLIRCPSCSHEFDPKAAVASAMIRLTKADRPFAFNSWIRHLYATRQTYSARYWSARGYILVPSEYPPVADKPTVEVKIEPGTP